MTRSKALPLILWYSCKLHVIQLWATILIIKQPSVPANFTWTHNEEQGFVTNSVFRIVANACVSSVICHRGVIPDMTWQPETTSRSYVHPCLWATILIITSPVNSTRTHNEEHGFVSIHTCFWIVALTCDSSVSNNLDYWATFTSCIFCMNP